MGLCEFRIAHVRVVAAAEMSALTVRNGRVCTYRQVFVCESLCVEVWGESAGLPCG